MFFYLFHNNINYINNEPDDVKNKLVREVAEAKKEWELALNRFNEVSDPEVVDYFIYYIVAAERRYMYLLRQCKTMVNKE